MFFWYVIGQIGFVVIDDSVFYGFGYVDWVFGFGDGGVYQNVIIVQFYCNSCI